MLTSNKVEEIVFFALLEKIVKLGILEPFTYRTVFVAPKKKKGRRGHVFFESTAVFNQSGTRINVKF